MNVTLLRGLIAISSLAWATGIAAQEADESALDALDRVPSVQTSAEPAGAAQLRAAIRRISYNASDADALADAGDASLSLGDANAALNFFTRANVLRPRNGRIVSGLATATVRTENPFEALRLFDDAIKLGVSERAIAAERALAFDLLGNFDRAQQDYKLARSASSSDDLVIRQAISLSLGGQKAESDAMLVPLLQKNIAGAWRARAFMLASRGDFRESAKVTQGFMDAASAQRMERYLRLMPELTGAQQAAAIHLGHFPASQYVGRDSEQVRRVASTIPPVQPAAENRLIPTGAPLGTKTADATAAKTGRKAESKSERKAREREEVKAAAARIPESLRLPKVDNSRVATDSARAKIQEAQTAKIASIGAGGMPPPETARAAVSVKLPVRAAATNSPRAAAAAGQTLQPTAFPPTAATNRISGSAASVSTAAASAPSSSSPLLASNTISSAATTSSPAAPVPLAPSSTAVAGPVLQAPMPDAAAMVRTDPPPAATVSVPVAAAPAFDLASIVSSITIPESEQKPSAVPVDLKKIKPATLKTAVVTAPVKGAKVDPKVAAKAKIEAANPARFWVQIATGDAGALGFDYRKWSKKTPELFKSQAGWTSEWGKTDRLLVGPFADMKIAKKWESDFKKAGGDGFMWKSDNGVVVTALKSK